MERILLASVRLGSAQAEEGEGGCGYEGEKGAKVRYKFRLGFALEFHRQWRWELEWLHFIATYAFNKVPGFRKGGRKVFLLNSFILVILGRELTNPFCLGRTI